MYFQTQALSKDKGWTTCTIVDNSDQDKWIVEYNDAGLMVRTEIDPEEIKHLDYSGLEISQ
jgi:hypothetical protein